MLSLGGFVQPLFFSLSMDGGKLFYKRIIVFLLVVVLGLALLLMYAHEKFQPHPKGGNFTLKDGEKEVSLSKFRNNIVVLVFGYTACPDFCPRELSAWNQAYRDMTYDERENVQIVVISIDAKRDSPQDAANYANNYNSDFVGLSGSQEKIAKVAATYGVKFEKDFGSGTDGYLYDHTMYSYILDYKGRIVEMLTGKSPVSQRLNRVRYWLSQNEPSKEE